MENSSSHTELNVDLLIEFLNLVAYLSHQSVIIVEPSTKYMSRSHCCLPKSSKGGLVYAMHSDGPLQQVAEIQISAIHKSKLKIHCGEKMCFSHCWLSTIALQKYSAVELYYGCTCGVKNVSVCAMCIPVRGNVGMLCQRENEILGGICSHWHTWIKGMPCLRPFSPNMHWICR